MKFRSHARTAAIQGDADPTASIEELIGSRSTTLRPEVGSAIMKTVIERFNVDSAERRSYDELVPRLEEMIAKVVIEGRYHVNAAEQHALALQIADDMLGNGPLEPLLHDDEITDIMVNGPDKVYIEKKGHIFKTGITFRDEPHLRSVANRMARFVNRRLDEASPMVDARLPDGSRVNIVIPPIALDGTCISIRRFRRQDFTLEAMVRNGSISDKMKGFLEIAAQSGLNIIISGGTSSGKTTLLNALSRNINNNERVITIEDSAELRLQQPHVIRLETRPRGIDTSSVEVHQRDLVSNALRMRPDRIILGEVRQGEAFDLLQAMNTGHAGMGTLHANTARDALSRLENMILMAGFDLPIKAIRNQIASSVDLIIQAERMTDGMRRVTRIEEVTGMEGETITTQELFRFEMQDVRPSGIKGEFICNSVNLRCTEKLRRFGLAKDARQIFGASL